MRSHFTTLALLLTACSPTPPAPDPPAPTTSPIDAGNGDDLTQALAAEYAANAALLQAGPVVAGQWFFRGDDGVFSAGFGMPQSEFQFTVACKQPTGDVTVMSDHELAPDQPTTLSLITEGSTVNLPAHSFNEGLPHVAAEPDGGTELARAVAINLGDPQTRFGVRVGEDVRVYPWDPALTRALEACR